MPYCKEACVRHTPPVPDLTMADKRTDPFPCQHTDDNLCRRKIRQHPQQDSNERAYDRTGRPAVFVFSPAPYTEERILFLYISSSLFRLAPANLLVYFKAALLLPVLAALITILFPPFLPR